MALTGLTNLQPLHIKTVGIGTFDNTVSIGGTLTYEDVTNVDAIGIITARSGVNVSGGQLDVGSNIKLGNAGVITATSFVGSGANLTGISAGAGGDTGLDLNDNVKIRLGTGNDIEFYHSGSHNFIDITNGQLRIRHGTDNAIKTIADGAVILYYDGGQKIQTTTGGIEISGQAVVSGDVRISDSGRLKIGTGQDLEIWHNGGTGNSNIKQQTGDIYFYTGSDLNMLLRDGTSVDLYYANSKKFETVTGGIKVTGAYALAASSGNNPTIDNADGGQGRSLYFKTGGSARLIIQEDGHTRPASDNTFDLGTSTDRWRNLYTTDLHLSNKGKTNDVDGTWGDWTLQEGENKIFMINNRTGKKYSLKMEEE